MLDSTERVRMRIEELSDHADYRPLHRIAGLAVDLRYATPRNFAGRNLYQGLDCAWLHVQAANALQRSVQWLAREAPGLRLAVLDALRPHRVQLALWQHLAGTGLQRYLADPARGSVHSYGMAVDVTLLDPQGTELDMGTAFDTLHELSHPVLEAEHLAQGRLSAQALRHRDMLRGAMQAGGFVGIDTEWWHFDCGDREAVRRGFVRIE